MMAATYRIDRERERAIEREGLYMRDLERKGEFVARRTSKRDDGRGRGGAMMTVVEVEAALGEANNHKRGKERERKVREGEGEPGEDDDGCGGGRTMTRDGLIRLARWDSGAEG